MEAETWTTQGSNRSMSVSSSSILSEACSADAAGVLGRTAEVVKAVAAAGLHHFSLFIN